MIIDFHVHIFPDTIAEKAVGKLARISGIIPFTDGTVSDTLQKAKDCGIDLCVCLNIATKPHQQTSINNDAARINREYNTLTAFGSVHPDAGDSLDELHRIKQLGIKGVKFHPDYQDFFVSDKKLYPVYDLCGQLSLPVVMHTGWDCYSPDVIHAVPEELRKIALAFPETTFIFAHMGGLKLWDDTEKYLTGLNNVYFDTAVCASIGMDKRQAERILLKHPPENVLMGSDCPWEDIRTSIRFIESFDISDDFKEKIFYKNAAELLNLRL